METYDLDSNAKNWDLIDVEGVFSPRDFPAIFPISTTKIAILGGQERNTNTDAIILNTKSRRAKQITIESNLAFSECIPPSIQIYRNEALAFLYDSSL